MLNNCVYSIQRKTVYLANIIKWLEKCVGIYTCNWVILVHVAHVSRGNQ